MPLCDGCYCFKQHRIVWHSWHVPWPLLLAGNHGACSVCLGVHEHNACPGGMLVRHVHASVHPATPCAGSAGAARPCCVLPSTGAALRGAPGRGRRDRTAARAAGGPAPCALFFLCFPFKPSHAHSCESLLNAVCSLLNCRVAGLFRFVGRSGFGSLPLCVLHFESRATV